MGNVRFQSSWCENMIKTLLMVIAAVAAVVWATVLPRYFRKKRQDEFAWVAKELGLDRRHFEPRIIRMEFPHIRTLNFLGIPATGLGVLSGHYRDHDVLAFDLSIKTKEEDAYRNNMYQSAVCLRMKKEFPKLLVRPGTAVHKTAYAPGAENLDLDNLEFSKHFSVRCESRGFASAFFSPRMMEFFLANPHISLEVAGMDMVQVFEGKLKPREIKEELDLLARIRELMPDHLFASSQPPESK